MIMSLKTLYKVKLYDSGHNIDITPVIGYNTVYILKYIGSVPAGYPLHSWQYNNSSNISVSLKAKKKCQALTGI